MRGLKVSCFLGWMSVGILISMPIGWFVLDQIDSTAREAAIQERMWKLESIWLRGCVDRYKGQPMKFDPSHSITERLRYCDGYEYADRGAVLWYKRDSNGDPE